MRRGAIRDRTNAGPVPVRAAPFDQAAEIDRLAPGSEFFICSRSNDQRWFGIVYDEGGQASDRCGVSAPLARRTAYQGPCAAGWVPSASVRLISGIAHQVPPAAVAGSPSASRLNPGTSRKGSATRREVGPIRRLIAAE